MTKILIVDDNSNDRYMLEALLKGYGYDVTSAGNGAQALLLARKDPPDMIISDIMMPVMDGFGLCREWKKNDKLKNIPFIFYTATYTTHKDEEFAKNLGADRFIIKPQETEVLIAKLREVIEEPRAVKLVVSEPLLGEEMEFFRQYNEVLFQKLERKITQLHTEINERKRAEEAHAILASIVEFSNDAVIGKTLDGRIMSWNPGAKKIYGYSADEVIDKPVSMLGLQGHFDETPKILEKIKQGETIKHFEAVRMRKDGTRIDVSLTISPIKDAEGRIIGASTIARDITDNKLMEKQLRIASLYTRNLIEVSLDPLVTISKDGKITDVNATTELVTGVSREQLIGSDFSDYFTEPEKAREGYMEVFEKGFVKDYPLAIRHVSGSITDVLYNASLYKDASGNVAGVFAAARDITERKKAEEELEKYRKHLEEIVNERTGELRDSEAKYRTLYESSSDAIMLLDENGFFDCNNATLQMFGFSKKEDFTRVHPADVSPPYQPDGTDSLTAANNKIAQAFRKGMNIFEWMHRRQNAEDFPAEVLLTAFQLGEKQVLQATVRDITQRKKVEDELLTEKLFTDAIISSVPGTFYVVDDQGGFIRWNKTVEEITGFSAEKLRSMNSLMLIHEDDRKRIADKIKEVFEKGFTEDVARLLTRNGIRNYILNGRRMAFGKNMYLVGCGIDITDRKRAMEMLRQSEEKFKSIFDNALDGILLVDIMTKKFLMGNRMIFEMLGYDEEELMNLSLDDLHTEKDLPYVLQQFEKEARKEIGFARDIPIKRKDGSIFYADIKSGPVIIGGKTYITGIFRDITERKRAEKEMLLQSAIVGNMAEGVCLVRVDDSVIVYANPKFERMFGYDAGELNGKPVTKLHSPQTENEAVGTSRVIIAELKEKGEATYDAHNMKKDGTLFWCRAHTSTLKHPEFGTVWVAIQEDITERKQAEESLQAAKEEAERANMAKTNFLNTMSHELRTPLNAILGFSEMMKLRTFGELNEKQEHAIDNIITGGKNLHIIISQILDAVKMDEGTFELRIENISVPETLDKIIGVIKEKAAKKNVLLKKKFDPRLEYIETDKQKFKQIFINLLDNAVKFSKDEGGTVIITAKKEGEMAKFSVSDTGVGIKEEDMDKIFRKFTQLNSGTTRKYGGTGLGLSITKQLVELHGGKIWAESKYGEGSTFTFTLPLVAKKEEKDDKTL